MSQNRILLLTAVFLFTALINSACVQQNSSLAAPEPSVSDSNPAGNSSSTTGSSRQIEAAQKTIEKQPAASIGYNMLAAGYIRLARETGDFSINSKAEAAVDRALAIEPANLNALKLKTSLMLTFHKFAEALDFASKLNRENPQDAFFYGALTDANVELGNYPEAVAAVQKMVDLKPNLASYARVSFVRTLHGDSKGSIEMMQLAARIADPGDPESKAWCLYRLGDEYFKVGNFAAAEQTYDSALQVFPDYHYALAGKGRARAAVGDNENAVKFLTQAQTKVPLTETVIFLGDVYLRIGDQEKSRNQYELAEAIESKIGISSDQRRLALLWADRDIKLDEALEIAVREHAARKDVFTTDILAWCLYKKGDFVNAEKRMTEAMRLKTIDARMFYHLGMIEKGLGNKIAAVNNLKKALQMNSAFDVVQAETAKTTLQELQK